MRKEMKKFLNRVLAVVLSLSMLAPCLPQNVFSVSANTSKVGTMEYITTFEALSGDKLPEGDATQYATGTYTRNGTIIQNLALLNSTATSTLNSAGETVAEWTLMDTTITDKWDLVNIAGQNSWQLIKDNGDMKMVFKTASYSDTSLTAYVAFKVNIPTAGTYNFQVAANSRNDYSASPALYVAPYDATAQADLNSIRTVDANSDGTKDYYLSHLDTTAYDGTYKAVSDVQLVAGDYVVLFALDAQSLVKQPTVTSEKQHFYLCGFKFVPVATPTSAPTEAPSLEPTAAPTEAPSLEPTAAPTEAPSLEPTPTTAPSGPLGNDFILDLGFPTDGVVHPVDGTVGPIVHSSSKTYTQQFTKALKGNGWILNTAKTNIPADTTNADYYVFNTTEGALYHSPKTNTSAFKTELETPYMMTLRMAPGNTVAFDFNVQTAGAYNLQIVYGLNGAAAATVTVNDAVYTNLIPENAAATADAKTDAIVVHLLAGTNTISFKTEGDSAFSAIRAAYFTKVDDATPTNPPAAAPTEAPTPAPSSGPATAADFAFVAITVGDLRTEADAMARFTNKQISVKLLDASNNELTNIDSDKLSVQYSSTDTGIASVDYSGMITSNSNGTTQITASVTYDGKTLPGTWNLVVADAGYNLLEGSNHDFESDAWLWNWANVSTAPASPVFMRTTIGTMANDTNANNRAFQIVLDGDVAAGGNPKDLKFNTTGARIKVEANKFYELSFKVKTDYVTPSGAADLMFLMDLTAYTTVSGDNSSFYPYTSRRQMDLCKVENWRDTYDEWTTVTLPISAPTACENEYIYLTPHFVLRPNDLTQAGYEGSIWIDDMQIREVGFEKVDIEVSGELASTNESGVSFLVTPYATSGNKMSLSSDFLAADLSMASNNERVVGGFGKASVATPVASSGQNIASVAADMNGGIGDAIVSAAMTLNGITRYADLGVSTVDTEVKLLYAEAGFAVSNILPGNTIQMDVVAYNNDNSVANISAGTITYKSLTPEVLSVDENGLVTGVGNGVGQVLAEVTVNGITVEAIGEITVKDDTKIVSASLSGSSTVGYLRDTLLTLNGINESGYATDFSQADVEWVISSGAVTVDDNFYAYGAIKDETVSIYANVTLNGNTVQTNTIEMTVVETDMRDFQIDFRNQGIPDATDATLENNGWKLAPGITYRTPLNTDSGLVAYTDAVGTKFAMEIDVPYEGAYQIVLEGYSQTNNTAQLADIYMDGIYIGDYIFTVGSNTELPAENLRTVYLTTGTHTITMIPTVSGAKKARMAITTLTFKNKEALPLVSSIDTNGAEVNVVLGDTYDIAATMKTEDGFVYAWQKMLSGADDPMADIQYSVLDSSVATISDKGIITTKSGGSTNIWIAVNNNGIITEKYVPITVDDSDIDLAATRLSTSRTEFYVGETFELGLDAVLTSGAKLTEDKYTVTWTSSENAVLSFEGNKLTANAVGTVDVSATISYFGKEATLTGITFTVKEDEFGKVIVSADSTRLSPSNPTTQLTVTGETHLGVPVDLTNATITYHSLNGAYATVSDTGLVTAGASGTATIVATVELNGITVNGEIELVVADQKTGRTYYTEEVVAIARENYAKYGWVQNEVNTYIWKSQTYLMNFDRLYSYIAAEGIPRTWLMQNKNAPDEDKGMCALCGNGAGDGGHTFNVDPFNMPWKVQCKYCYNWFPSNDFAGLYDNVIAANNGVYDVEFAKQWNAQNVANGGKDYLKNELYPQYGDDWGVDAGEGYFTSETHSNGVTIQYNFIPYFVHCGIWYCANQPTRGIMMQALENLSMAYLFTGEEKYGRACAILVDRIADVYPSFTQEAFASYYSAGYHTSNGSSGFGKILGCIWECFLGQLFPVAYDAVYDMYDDPEVIEFLSNKAVEYNLANDKTTGEKIRQNIEDNLLREIAASCYNGQIMGNFGLPQNAMAVTAIVLDSHPETDEMLDWLYTPQQIIKESDTVRHVTGGGLLTNMVNNVSRDGQGNESAFGYNDLWVTNLLDVGIAFERYDEYDGMKLFDHPRYVSMILSYPPTTLVRRGAPALGDGGAYAKFSGILDIDTFCIPAFDVLYERHPQEAKELAEYIYSRTGGSTVLLRGNSFMKDPESIGTRINDLAKAEPVILDADKSTNMTGYGLAVLRSGTMSDSKNALGLYDTQRDIWMYYGGGTGHKHKDALSIGIEAYGVNQSSDLGYPEGNANNQNKAQWQTTSIAHNTVVVNEQSQVKSIHPGKNLHFDGKGERVQVMDVDASHVYAVTDEYRRTIVMVDYDENISYGIDFFKIIGGDDHLYSFHANSDITPVVSEGIEFVTQDARTYAGKDVPYGNDPGTNDGYLMYPAGYSWLTDVHKAENPGVKEFFVDFITTDYRKNSINRQHKYNLRMTMLNDFEVDEISLVNGQPPRKAENEKILHIEYMLVRRTGKNLNSLFTTVIEPYTGLRYIQNLQQLPVTVSSQSGVQPGSKDAVKAIKADLINGRTDYIFYSTNEDVLYTLTDGDRTIDFRGFVGVVSYDANGDIVYTYVHEGTTIANVDNAVPSINGIVLDFERDFAFNTWADIRFERAITDDELADLADRVAIFDRNRDGNSDIMIKNVERLSDTDVRLNFGIIQLIDNYIDDYDVSKGYVYDIEEGMGVKIALSSEINNIVDYSGYGNAGTPSAGGTNTSTENATTSDTTAAEDNVTETEQVVDDAQKETSTDGNNAGESTESGDKSETVTEATPAPSEDPASTGEPSPTPEADDANASGNGVRNILLGGLGVVALAAGLFFILLGKKKEEDEN